MALSIFTNTAAMSSTNALNRSNNALSTAMERLGTGKRVNSSADDAAGLQIAVRLQAQANGMAVAQRNISDATAMLQTAEGAFDEVTNVLHRMKDLVTQGANGTNSTKDIAAIQTEFQELGKELTNIMTNTSFSGESLFGATKLGGAVTFQIGATAAETTTFDVSADLTTLKADLALYATADLSAAGASNTMITTVTASLNSVAEMRADFGASINRLDHTSANLSNMSDNTKVALGNIMDADFATEATNMTRNQLLSQTSMSMLKQANSMPGMVLSLLN